MAHIELRFGTVVSVAGRTAKVRVSGMADPVPVRCVESVPAVGAKIPMVQTAQAIYYLGAAPPVKAGKITTTQAIQPATLAPPAGRRLVSVVASLDGGALFWLSSNGYRQAVVGVEVLNPTTGACNFVRYGVGTGTDLGAVSLSVHYIAYYE